MRIAPSPVMPEGLPALLRLPGCRLEGDDNIAEQLHGQVHLSRVQEQVWTDDDDGEGLQVGCCV